MEVEQIKLHTGKMNKDGNWQTDSPLANLVAHAVLGAVVAELQGNSGVVGGASSVSGELAAPIIQKALYGDWDIKDLTEEEKENLSALTQLAVGLTIASMGGDSSDITTGVNSSKNAIENNYLFAPEDKERKDAQAKLNLINEGLLVVSDKEKQELEGQVAILNALDAQRDEILNIACQNLSSSECNALRIELQLAYESYFKTLSPEDYLAYNDAYANYTKYYDGYKKILSQLTELEGRDLADYNEYKAQNLSDGLRIFSARLNHRPRKRLKFKTPHQIFYKLDSHLAFEPALLTKY